MSSATDSAADTADDARYSIHEVARLTGLTSRTLRHYDHVGLLRPAGVGAGGTRHYDGAGLLRLQRIVLLRELGLSLEQIGHVLDGERDQAAALRAHLGFLHREKERIEAMIRSVEATIAHLHQGVSPMAHEMFDGFDHTQYRDEVIERWGENAYQFSDRWYRGLTSALRVEFMDEATALAKGFGAARAASWDPESDQVQELAARHYRWVAAGWGGKRPSAEQYVGLGELYVADPRFAQHYDRYGSGTAELVRDAVRIYAERSLDREDG